MCAGGGSSPTKPSGPQQADADSGSTAGLNSAVPKDRSVPEKQWLQGWALLWTLSTLPPCPELWSPRSLSPCHERCCHTKSLYIDIWQV